MNLPASHYFVQISPTISAELSKGRPYKLFVAVNGTRLTQRDTRIEAAGEGEDGEDGEIDGVGRGERRTHVYEGSLAQGTNRVEVEVAAAADGEGDGVVVERMGVFLFLGR